jgi:hypothetical protein
MLFPDLSISELKQALMLRTGGETAATVRASEVRHQHFSHQGLRDPKCDNCLSLMYNKTILKIVESGFNLDPPFRR